MGIFADWGPKYWEAGYSIIPVIGKKAFTEKWSEKPSENDFNEWCEKYPDANIGVLCGKNSGIVAFDYDYEGPDAKRIEEIILNLIPPSPVEKVGRKGWTKFYRYNGLKFKSINRNNARMVDFLSDGKQTVVPPSIHPETKKEYKWTSKYDLLNFDFQDLPEFTSDIWDKLTQLASFDLTSDDNIFGNKSGRHDRVCAYGWAIIESVRNVEDFVKKLLEYDQRKHKDTPYFADKKYWGNTVPSQAALEIARKIEKTVSRSKQKEGGLVWEIGSDYASLKEFDIESNIKFDSGHYSYVESKDGSITAVPDYDSMANSLHRNKTVLTSSSGNYVYKAGKWHHLDDTWFDNIVLRMTNMQCKPGHFAGFVKKIKAKCYFGDADLNDVSNLINLKNGILNIKTGELLKRSSRYFFKNVSPVEYDEKATCENFDKFLDFIFQGDDELKKLVQDMFGYVLLGGYPFLHRAFVLHGSGRNGKSTLLDVLKGILGDGTWSAVSMSMIDKPFSAVMLDGKLANIVTEISSRTINSEVFKSLVAGEPITASYKGKDEYSLIPSCRVIFACNDMPKFGDNTVGMQDRLILIPFDNYIKESDRDMRMSEKLKAEYSGILNWALEGAKRVLNKRAISSSIKSDELKAEYIKDSDQVASWFDECVEISKITDANEVLKKTTAEIYNIYSDWAEVNGHYKLARRSFEMRLSRLCKTKDATVCPKSLYFGGDILKGYDRLKFKHIFKKKNEFDSFMGRK